MAKIWGRATLILARNLNSGLSNLITTVLIFLKKQKEIFHVGNRRDFFSPHYEITRGTIPILRQQRDCVGGVRKLAIFTDVQYYLCWHRVGRWVKKSPKMCWRNIGMVPNILRQHMDWVEGFRIWLFLQTFNKVFMLI